MAQSLISNATIATFGRIISTIVGIIITATLTRLLGVNGYGVYTLLISLGVMLQVAADFGLYLTLTRDIAAHPKTAQSVYSVIAALRLFLLTVLFVIGIIIAAYIPSYHSHLLPLAVIALGLIFQSLSQLQMGVYQAHGLVWRATVGDLAGRLVQLSLVIFFPFIPTTASPLVYFTLAFTLGTAIALTIHSVLLPKINPWKYSIDIREWKKIAKKSWPLGALLILNVIYFRIDIIMLSLWHSGEQVGWYGLAYRIVESGLFFPAMFGGLLLPKITSALTISNGGRARQLVEQGVYIVTLAIPLILVIIMMRAKQIIIFLSGVDYASASPLLQILSIALAVMFIGNIFGFTLVALQKQKQLLKLYIALAIFNLMANALFIPSFGASAAAWTTVVTEAMAMIIAGRLVFKSLVFSIKIKPIAILGLIAIATILITARLPMHWHILIQLTIIVGIYGVAALSTGLLRRERFHLLIEKA